LDRKIFGRDDRPLDLLSLRQSIASREIILPAALTKIGRFALAHPDTVAFASGRELAEITGTSPSSVSRFSTALGFHGHADLRRFFQNHVRQQAERWPVHRSASEAYVVAELGT